MCVKMVRKLLKEGKDYKFEENHLTIFRDNKWQGINDEDWIQEEIINAGANGVTVLCRNEKLNKKAVMKVWIPRQNDFCFNEKKYRDKYEAEMQKIAQVNIPEVVTPYYGKIINDCGVMLMDYIDGDTLEKWLCHQHKYINKIYMCKKVLNAIMKYQAKGIIHGDLHTKNILITKENDVRIIDFGTSLLSNHVNSVNRECCLIFDTIEQILKSFEFFNNCHFCFSVIRDEQTFRAKKIVINYPDENAEKIMINMQLSPKLMTETLLSYLEILNIYRQIGSFDKQTIVEVGILISKTRYIDANNIKKSLYKKFQSEKDRNILDIVIAENIEEMIDDKFIEGTNPFSATSWFVMSACAYYDITKQLALMSDYKGTNQTLNKLAKNINKYDFYSFVDNISLDDSKKYNEINQLRRNLFYEILENRFSKVHANFIYWITTRILTYYCDSRLVEKCNHLCDLIE